MKILFRIFIIMFLQISSAQGAGGKTHGVSAELDLGKPSTQITNPDSTIAYYTGLSAGAKGFIPLLTQPAFSINLYGSIRYLDLKNTSSSSVIEMSQMIGPGLGLEVGMGPLYLGYETHSMRVRHITTGNLSNYFEYNMTTSGYSAGFLKTINQLSVGIVYNKGTGSIAESDTGFTKPGAFTEETYWLILRYNLGMSFPAFLKSF